PRPFTDAPTPGDHLPQFLDALLDLLDVGEPVVHLPAVGLGQDQLLQPGDARLGREPLGGHLPPQVVAAPEGPGLVAPGRPGLAGLLAQRRQLAVRLIGAAGAIDLAPAADRLALPQAVAVDPQPLTERGGVPAIGLALLTIIGPDQDHLVAVVVVQHADQP